MALETIKRRFSSLMCSFPPILGGKFLWGVLALVVLALTALGLYWNTEPDTFSVRVNAETMAQVRGHDVVTGYTTTAAIYRIADTLLTKPGGYIRNDIAPPGVFLDNISSWELGVLVQIRDVVRSLRRDIGRSQSQSKEDQDLAVAEPQFNFDANSWIMPSSEKEYRRGITKLESYLSRLQDSNDPAQFYPRADNLARWLGDVETRLGSLSQRLSASIGKPRLNTDLAGDSAATQSTAGNNLVEVKTPWLDIDDVFYEARGTSWALIHLLKAIEIDFADVLEKKQATVSVRQIIRELEATQETIWSPMILNGSSFGILANHSLVMANYISRANVAINDLRRLLENG